MLVSTFVLLRDSWLACFIFECFGLRGFCFIVDLFGFDVYLGVASGFGVCDGGVFVA